MGSALVDDCSEHEPNLFEEGYFISGSDWVLEPEQEGFNQGKDAWLQDMCWGQLNETMSAFIKETELVNRLLLVVKSDLSVIDVRQSLLAHKQVLVIVLRMERMTHIPCLVQVVLNGVY